MGRPTQGFRPALDVTPEILKRQINQLRSWGFSFVTMAEAWKIIEKGDTSARCVALTFDDVGGQFVNHALPTLVSEGARATAFVIGASLLDNHAPNLPESYIPPDPEMLRDIVGAGIELGSHAMTHRELPSLPDDQARSELSASKKLLEKESGRHCESLCYPRGAFSLRIEEIARQCGYTTACVTARGTIHGEEDRFRLGRIRACCKLSGWRLWLAASRFYHWKNTGHARRCRERWEASDRFGNKS